LQSRSNRTMNTIIARKVIKTSDSYDIDNVNYFDQNGKKIGHGYRSKKNGTFHIVKCPVCEKENYALSISSGLCAFCNFDANI